MSLTDDTSLEGVFDSTTSEGRTLTDAQKNKKKSVRPNYFNAAAGSYFPISEGFEEFLILLPTTVKSGLQSFISSMSEESMLDIEGSALLLAFLESELASLSVALSYANLLLADLDNVSAQINLPNFEDAPEKSLMIEDMQLDVDALVEFRNDLVYIENMIKAIHKQHLSGRFELRIDNNRLSQIRSWGEVVIQYL